MMHRRKSVIRRFLLSALLCAGAAAAAPLVGPEATGGVERVGAALESGAPAPAAFTPVPLQADPPEWAPTRTPEGRRQLWDTIGDEAEFNLGRGVTGGVDAALFSSVDAQLLSAALLGQPPEKPKVEIPVGREPGRGGVLFKNLSPAGLFNLAFAFLILIVLAIKARSGS
jgi:hypothetical protein